MYSSFFCALLTAFSTNRLRLLTCWRFKKEIAFHPVPCGFTRTHTRITLKILTMSLLFVHYEHPSVAASTAPRMIYARRLNHKEPKASHLPAGFRMPGMPCEDEHFYADLLDFGPGGPPWSILGHYADLELSYFSEPNRTNTPEPWLDQHFARAVEQRFRAEAIQVPEWILPDPEEEDSSLGMEPEEEMPYWGQGASPPESTWSDPDAIWDPPTEHPEADNEWEEGNYHRWAPHDSTQDWQEPDEEKEDNYVPER
jgi:hypothetical protein